MNDLDFRRTRVPIGPDDEDPIASDNDTAAMVPPGRPVPITAMAPSGAPPKPKPAPIGGPATNAQPINPTLDADKARFDYLKKSGSGLSQLTHPVDAQGNPTGQHVGIGHKIGAVLGRIGDIAGTALFPSITAQIPGTELHHQVLVNQAAGRVANDLKTEQQEAVTRNLENPPDKQAQEGKTVDTGEGVYQWNPETERYDIKVGPSKAADKTVANPQAGYAAAIADAMKRGVDPATDPHVTAWRSAIEDLAKTTPEKADDKARAIYSKDPKTWTPDEKAFIKGYEKQVDITKTQPGVARMEILNDPKWASLDLQKQRMVSPYVQNAMDSAKIDDLAELIMNDVKKRGGKITGPEFMQLLSYHMAGTIGGIKGMKGGIEMLKEHVNARPWSQSLEAMYNKAVNGGDVSLAQAQEWAQLAKDRRRIFLDQARQANELYGANLDLNKITTPTDQGGGAVEEYVRDPKTGKLVKK